MVLNTPDNVVLSIPVILPEGVPLHDETSLKDEDPMQLVAAVDESSDLLQAPITAIIPTINANQSTIFS